MARPTVMCRITGSTPIRGNNNHANPIIPVNAYSQSQFGGTFGGPIKRDKLFFFVDYLGARYHTGGTGQASVFTQAMRNGDFSALLAGSNPIQLYDPLNGFAPYAGNTGVPIVNPVAKFLFANPKLYPLPNATPSDGIVANNLQGPQRTTKPTTRETSRLSMIPGPRTRSRDFSPSRPRTTEKLRCWGSPSLA